LGDEEDAFGHLLLDALAGRAGEPLLERDDGHVGPALEAAVFFREPHDWAAPERRAFAHVEGRVLDIGCGAGRHALAAQAHGHDVVAIDIATGAIQVCRQRGVRDARLVAVADVDEQLGSFDTVLMMCGNAGLAGSEADTVTALATLHHITTAGARIVLDSVDPYLDPDEADIAYLERNRAAGRMPGLVTIRLRYSERVTPWFDLLCLSPAELHQLAGRAGWTITWLERDDPDFYAVLHKR
jgi:SAM-dependent methyltransferase